MKKSILRHLNLLIMALSIVLSGCTSTPVAGDISDPFESINRGIFNFNEGLDKAIIKPLALTYKKLPQPVQTGTHNFFNNLEDVVVISNDLLQLKGQQLKSDLLRVTANTTFGMLGLIDVATPMGFPKNEESFADTLGYWGVRSGPYLVLPILGPSSLRDAPALIVDFLIHPISLVSPTSAVIGLATVEVVDTRSVLLDTIDLRDNMALDTYIFTRESYNQFREFRIHDGDPPKVIIEDFEEPNFDE